MKALRWIGAAGLVIWLAGCNLSASNGSSDSSTLAPSTPSKGMFDPARTFRNPQAQALARAAQDNNAADVRRLIKNEHINPDTLFSDTNDEERIPVVAWPVITQSLVGLKALLDNGADPNIKMRYPALDKTDVRYYDNAMVVAATNEDPAYLKMLLEHGGDPNTQNVSGETLLFQAYIWHNQWQNVQILVEHGVDMAVPTQGSSILGNYTQEGDFNKAYWLLQHGADPKVQGMYGVKPGDVIHYHAVEDIFWYPDKPNMRESKRKCQQWLLAHGFQRPPMPGYYRSRRKDLGQPYEEKGHTSFVIHSVASSLSRSDSMTSELELEREREELKKLHDRGDPASLHYADRLQQMYHVRQMDGLSQDVYYAAKGRSAEGDEKQPPQGWTRLSEHPELMQQYAAKLGISPRQLQQTLHPDRSGFRAEIYLPDAALQQAGYKPTLAFKGSTGVVMTSDGKTHDTSAEDFGANNFPQSVGLETDYYDRAMNLGYQLSRAGVDFESTGHSLSGGMAAAAAAVTNTHATTFNAAGLNPITAERFAQQNPGVVVSKDLNHLITNYQVQGELLSDGVQNNIHNMDALRRLELGATLKEACDVLQRVPEAKSFFAQKLSEDLPPQAQATVNAFVDKVATGNTDQLLRDLPLAVGEQHVLAAMTRDAQGNLVPRVQVISLPETTRLATPLLESLAVVSTAARIGERDGEMFAAGGHLSARGLNATGRSVDDMADHVGTLAQAATRFEGSVVQNGEHALGATLAQARAAQAEMTAQVDQRLGQAQHFGAEVDASILRGLGHLVPERAQHALQGLATDLERNGVEQQRQGVALAASDRSFGQADAAAIRGLTHAVESATLKGVEGYGAAQHAMIGGAGHYAREGLDASARSVAGATQHAPSAFAATGAVAGLGVVAVWELNLANYPRLAEAAMAISDGRQAASEAFEKHLLLATVTPSLDANIQAVEREADQFLQHSVPGHTTNVQHPNEPSHAPAHSSSATPNRAALLSQAIAPAEASYACNDPRHPDNPHHGLYQQLKERIPEASDKRLLQFTEACHAKGVGERNLGEIAFDRQGGQVIFHPSSTGLLATVDVKQPSPEPHQSIQHIQQTDQMQAQIQTQIQAQRAQINQQQGGMQRPMQ